MSTPTVLTSENLTSDEMMMMVHAKGIQEQHLEATAAVQKCIAVVCTPNIRHYVKTAAVQIICQGMQPHQEHGCLKEIEHGEIVLEYLRAVTDPANGMEDYLKDREWYLVSSPLRLGSGHVRYNLWSSILIQPRSIEAAGDYRDRLPEDEDFRGTRFSFLSGTCPIRMYEGSTCLRLEVRSWCG